MTIIADLGYNHNGDVALACVLAEAAAAAGCDYVKLHKGLAMAPELELDLEAFRQIDACCKKAGIGWFAVAGDVASQQFLRQFGLDHYGVTSEMITNTDLLEVIAGEDRHTFIDTGKSSWADIDTALAILSGVPYTLMHTVCEQPMPEEDANLRMMDVIRERYSCPVGYAGNEEGVFVSTLAFTLGAEAIERSLTLARCLPGSQPNALEPAEFKQLVDNIMRAQRIMGDGSREAAE